MRAVRTLLGKDLRVLRRSGWVLVALVLYPLVVAVIVGLVVRYAGDRPRVALVDEDGLPAVLEVGGQTLRRRADLRPGGGGRRARQTRPRDGRQAARDRRGARRRGHPRGLRERPARHGAAAPSPPAHDGVEPREPHRGEGAGARLHGQPRAPGGVHRSQPRVRRPAARGRQRRLLRGRVRCDRPQRGGRAARRPGGIAGSRRARGGGGARELRPPGAARSGGHGRVAAGDREPDRAR